MNEVLLEEKYVLEYIRYTLNDIMIGTSDVTDAKYHHNTQYLLTKSIIKHGILSLEELNKLGIRNYTNDTLKVMDDIESHINGKTGISLSIVGLTDLYRDEEEYDPFDSSLVDLLVSSDINAARNSCHYGNEFISKRIITPNNIKSVDIRLLQYIESDRYQSIDDIISKYNSLRKIALSIIKRNLDIKFREMSDGKGDIFDIDRLSNIPKIKIKNYS